MEKIKIDKGIEITGRQLTTKVSPFPFESMEVQDSFFVEVSHIPKDFNRKRAYIFNIFGNYLKNNKEQPQYKILTRKVDGGIRVWRIR